MKKTFLPDMTFREAEEAFQETDLALVPLGAIEAHGPHGLLGTDAYAAEEVAKRTGAKCNGIVAPVMPFGFSESIMDFPGTVSVQPGPYAQILESIVRCLHQWGTRRVIWVTGHGPNVAPMKEVSLALRRELGMGFASPLWYRLAIALLPKYELGPDHGGFTETSVAMAIRPGNVNLQEAEGGCIIEDLGHGFDSTGKYEIGFEDAGVDIPLFMKERWPLGYWDQSKPASEASEEAGEEILEVVTDYLARFADAFRALPLPTDE